VGAVCNRDYPLIVAAPLEKQRDAPPKSGMQEQAQAEAAPTNP